MTLLEKTNGDHNDYIVVVDSSLTIVQIEQIAMDETGVRVSIHYCGRFSDRKGDMRKYQYNVASLRLLGWIPKYSAEEAVRKAIKENL